jgi:hypothetical protein
MNQELWKALRERKLVKRDREMQLKIIFVIHRPLLGLA